jgi:hypothetical protein
MWTVAVAGTAWGKALRIVGAVVVAVNLAGAGCVAERLPKVGVAVRQVDGRFQFILTGACGGSPWVTRAYLTRPRGRMPTDKDPVLWAVNFDPPTAQGTFTVGRTPPGGVEKVALAPLYPNTRYTALIDTFGGDLSGGPGNTWTEDFEPGQLAGSKVRFHGRYMGPKEFASSLPPCARNAATPHQDSLPRAQSRW